LLDYRLGQRDGLELLRESAGKGCDVPVIVLTGQGDYRIDVEAMRSGAADYLIKDSITSDLLERAIRYSIERKRTESALRKARDELEIRVQERTTDLENANWALKESEERSRVLVEAALDIIYTISPDRIIRGVNPAFETITGWSAEEWVGKDFTLLVHPDDVSASMEGIGRSLRQESRNPAEVRIMSKSGEYIVLECKTAPHVSAGRVVGIIGTAHDITDRKRMEAFGSGISERRN
jgi:PAS domain S-box-containing protein